MIRTVVIAVALLASAVSQAAEIILREQAETNGPVLRLGDVADIAASNPGELDELVTTPLMPSPAPGAPQFLTGPQILDLLAARGLDVTNLHILGAEAVAIGGGDGSAADTPSVSMRIAQVRSGSIAIATNAVLDFLRRQTGHHDWNVTVQPDPELITALQSPSVGAPSISGGRAPWTGQQRFQLKTPTGQAVIAYAKCEQVAMVAFAVRAIERGDLVRTVDVEIRPYTGELPTSVVADLDVVVGKEALQSIRPDAMVLTTQVRAPIVVSRGERVEVTARAAGVAVRTFATAQQDGARGELVMVEALAGRERYAARVVGPQKLEVFAASPTASDLARLPRNKNR